MKLYVLLAALAPWSPLVGATVAPPKSEFEDRHFRVADVEARLLYEKSGTLSEDITDNPNFWGFNVIIGEGSAKENANDLLVTAVIVGPGQHNLRSPLKLIARDESGKLISTRTIEDILVEPKTYRSMLLHEVGCVGTISLTAQLGQSVRTEEVQLGCGE
jgi:hypothetical protein